MASQKFPKKLLVTYHEENNETPYLLTHESVEDIGEENDNEQVAVYELKDVTKFKVEKTLLDH